MSSFSPESETKQTSKMNPSLVWRSIISGSLVSLILNTFFFIYAVQEAAKAGGENLVNFYLAALGISVILSSFIGGLVAGGMAKHRQALHGILASLLFLGMHAILQIVLFKGTISLSFFFSAVVVILISALGGWIAKLIVPPFIRFNSTKIVSAFSASITLIGLLFPWAIGTDLMDNIPSTTTTISGYEFVFRQSALDANSLFVRTTTVEGVRIGSDPTLWLYKAIPTVALLCLLFVFTKLVKTPMFIKASITFLLSAVSLGGIALLISKVQFTGKLPVTLAGYGYSLSNLKFGFWVTAVGILGILAAEAMNLRKPIKENPLNVD